MNNWDIGEYVAQGLITEAEAKAVPLAVKQAAFLEQVWMVIFVPIAYLLVIYGLFVLDHIIKRRK